MSTAATTALRVYLIDDDPDHTLIVRRAISEVNPQAEVHSHDDGEAALAALREATLLPDLILLDINMEGLSGFEVLEQVKGNARLKHIPVVMLTSSTASSDIEHAYELGASGYISKPSYLHDLRAVIGNTLLYWQAMHRPGSGRSSP